MIASSTLIALCLRFFWTTRHVVCRNHAFLYLCSAVFLFFFFFPRCAEDEKGGETCARWFGLWGLDGATGCKALFFIVAFASLLHSHHHNAHNNVSGPTVSLFLGVEAMSGASGTVRRRKVARCIRVHTEGNWPACQASVMGKGTMQRQENLKRRGKKKKDNRSLPASTRDDCARTEEFYWGVLSVFIAVSLYLQVSVAA